MAGIRVPAWLIIAAAALFVLMTAAGVALVLRHHRRQTAPEDGLGILDSADPPAGVTFG